MSGAGLGDLDPRVFASNGSVQLVTAVVAGLHGERRWPGQRDVLVLHDLGPPGQEEAFADRLRAMATRLGGWSRVVYLAPDRWRELERLFGQQPAQGAAALHAEMGLAAAGEVFLVQNASNVLSRLLDALPTARRLCYGDGIGVNFSPTYFSPRPSLREVARRVVRSTLDRARGRPSALPPSPGPFDRYRLLLPNLFDQVLPEVDNLPAQDFVRCFHLLQPLLDGDETVARLEESLARGRPVDALLTTNFSENGRMTRGDEIRAYLEFLDDRPGPRVDLVVKPHPRDHRSKLLELRAALSGRYERVLLLDDPRTFHLPFEVVVGRASRRGGLSSVVCFSSACLSLELLYGIRCHVGLGERLVRQTFVPRWVELRIRHERDLERALIGIRQRAASIAAPDMSVDGERTPPGG